MYLKEFSNVVFNCVTLIATFLGIRMTRNCTSQKLKLPTFDLGVSSKGAKDLSDQNQELLISKTK